MSIPRHLVEEVRARTDIVAVVGQVVTLQRQGRSWVGLCPFHSDRKPSFHVVPDKGFFHCFPCGAHGDVFNFLVQARGLNFMEAVKELAGAAGVVIEERELTLEERRRVAVRADLHGVVEEAAKFFAHTLLTAPEGLPGREYLAQRGISLDTAEKYRLGFAPVGWDRLARHLAQARVPTQLAAQAGLVKARERSEGVYDTFRNRLLFPILDDRLRPVAFGGRLLPGPDDGPKYLNSPESPVYDKSRTLYGLAWGRGAIQRKDRAILVEGYFDAVSLWQAGFEEAVATCGTALTTSHVEHLRRLTRHAVALFDSDEAGMRAAATSMELFLDGGMEARRLDLAECKDPDEFVQKYGAAAFEAALARGEPLLELVIRRIIEKEGASVEGHARALLALAPTLRKFPDLVQGPMIARVAGILGVREERVIAAVSAAVPRAPARAASPHGEPARPDAPRWTPSRELAHLLWLAVHHPAVVAPLLAQADPDDLSSHREALAALVRLASGELLTDVVAACGDPDVVRVLLGAGARDDLYPPEAAAPAADAILARLALPRLDRAIADAAGSLNACQKSGDTSSYELLSREISVLHVQRAQLHARATRRRGNLAPAGALPSRATSGSRS